jgi:vesicle-fusing ATPase
VLQITLDAAEVADFLHRTFNFHVLKTGQQIASKYNEVPLKFTVKSFEFLDLATGQSAGAATMDDAGRFGQFVRSTEVDLRKSATAAIKITGSSNSKGNSRLFEKGFNFEALGIGGLNREFADIFRRAFASRVMPPDILKKMGQKHVRGMLLYGPPGCGKTLIARQIGKALHAHPPKIVNGPEILNKYVGQSEENIRKLFEDAEKEQAERGDDSELHIIIFDEFDAICRQRGTTGGGTGVNDSIVNQLLSKIDGVESLNNILLIGMTNRKDMLDEAVLRPGRLEVHIEIGLPDEEGRTQILNIHTSAMRKNKLIAEDVSVEDIASRTKNYTGAEIEGLVKTAVSYVFARQTDMADLTKAKSFEGVQLTREDFDRAIVETTPMFGVKEDELTRLVANDIISTGPDFERTKITIQRLLHQVATSDRTPLVSVILKGPAGSGKTALAAKLAIDSGFPFVKRISGEHLLGLTETGKCDAIGKVFNDAYKSPLSLIILDDLERLIEYVAVGQRFSNAVLQSLLVLVKALPPAGRRLFIMGTTAIPELLEHMELLSAFQLPLSVPALSMEDEYAAVFTASGALSPEDVDAAAKKLAGSHVGIKKLLTIIEMARQAQESEDGPSSPGPVAGRTRISFLKLMETFIEWGL